MAATCDWLLTSLRLNDGSEISSPEIIYVAKSATVKAAGITQGTYSRMLPYFF